MAFTNKWIAKKDWKGLSDLRGQYVWSDGKNIYYSYGSTQKILNKGASTWINFTWNKDFDGNNVWIDDGGNIYYSKGEDQWELKNSTWVDMEWSGLTNFQGQYIWSDGQSVYYSNYNSQYRLERMSTMDSHGHVTRHYTWFELHWEGFSNLDGRQIWSDGENIYYSSGNNQYKLNKETYTWEKITWSGIDQPNGASIWTDGENIYFSHYNTQKVLNKSTGIWEDMEWEGNHPSTRADIWTNGKSIYYSSGGSDHWKLEKEKEYISKIKVDDEIYNIKSLPAGGVTGQILTKTSDTDGEAEWKDVELGNKVSVEPKVSEGVNIASITIDGHTTELFAPEGGSSEPSTITIVNPNLYDTSVAVKGTGNDFNIYSEVSVSPNTDYVFDIQNSPYGWAGVRVGNTVVGNDNYSRKLVEFNSGTNTSVRLQFFPGNDTTVAQTDFTNILFYEAGKIPGETTTIENPNLGSGSNLVSTDITEILLTASSQHPIEIVLIGDSITEGYAATGSLSAGSTHPLPTWKNFPSWAGLLNRYITANFPNVTVTNRGYSGQVSAYGASNINSWITNNRQIAIVMFGTNNRTSQANMNSLANDYTTMLNRCKSVGAKMIPMCCIPTTPYNQSISGKYVGTMDQVHNILVNWAKTNGYELLDLYSLMMAYINNNTSNLESMGLIYVGSSDNNLHIHPNDAGHAVMFDFIKHKLGIGTAGGSGGGAKYRHRVALYCTNGGTTYVVVNLYNNRSTPYNAATITTTDEINTFKADVLAAGYSSALQKGTLMCSGVIKGSQVYGMYMGTSSSGLSAVADKLNFINGTNFNITLPLETGGTNSASSSLRLWDTVEPA